ncbi:MAG: DUF2905 domain-containing protein [Bacteriovoracaceae bacterium]
MKDSFYSQGPKICIIIGTCLILVGLIWQFAGKFLPFGKLPGDISIKTKNISFYFPIVSSIIISIIITIILNLFNKK